MKNIIGICGVAGSGKDTLAAQIVEKLGFQRIGFADSMRDCLYATNPIIVDDAMSNFYRLRELVDSLGWDKAKRNFKEVRELLQRFGTEGGRTFLGENVWIDALFNNIPDGGVVIPDVRFPNEASRIKEEGGVIFRVVRSGVEPINDHISETAYARQDCLIINDSTPEKLFEKFYQIYLTTF